MAVVGELRTLITARSDQMERTLARVEAKLARFGRQQKKTTTTLQDAQMVFGKVTAGLAAITAGYQTAKRAAAGFGDAVVKAAQQSEAKARFGLFFGDPAKGKQVVDDIKAFAATTPFQVEELRRGASMLAPYVSSYEKLIPTLKMLSELSAGSNASLSELVQTFSRNSQLVRQNTRDIREFGNRGIPVYDELKNLLQVNGTELQQMIEDGKVGFGDVEKALHRVVSEGGKFHDVLNVVGKEMTTKISNMQDVTDNIRTSFGQWLTDTLRLDQAFDAVLTKMKEIQRVADRESDRKQSKRQQRQAFKRDTPEFSSLRIAVNEMQRQRDLLAVRAASGEGLGVLPRMVELQGMIDAGTAALAHKFVAHKNAPQEPPDRSGSLGGIGRAVLGQLTPLGSLASSVGRSFRRRAFDATLPIRDVFGRLSSGGGTTSRRVGQAVFAGAATRGSAEAQRILQGARQQPLLIETKKHTDLLKATVSGIERLIAASRMGGETTAPTVPSLMGSTPPAVPGVP